MTKNKMAEEENLGIGDQYLIRKNQKKKIVRQIDSTYP